MESIPRAVRLPTTRPPTLTAAQEDLRIKVYYAANDLHGRLVALADMGRADPFADREAVKAWLFATDADEARPPLGRRHRVLDR